MLNRKFLDIDQIYQNTNQLKDFKSIFAHLEKLNKILRDNLPDNLRNLCHVGAYDNDKSIVVVYVESQQALHILKGFSDKLLQHFYMENYSFNNILLKVRIQNTLHPKQNPPIDSKKREQLMRLAKEIGKPDLVLDEITLPDDDEIKL